ncbi:MAG: hypothetical protein MUF62_01315 [Chitinophagaceae bacterium]|nr:hypothetical protein [Chitinophagaceae bacterium]
MQHLTKYRHVYLAVVATMLLAVAAVYPPFHAQAQPRKAGSADTARIKAAAPRTARAPLATEATEVDKALKEVERELQRLNKEEWPKVEEELARARAEMEKLNVEETVQKALREVDMKKVQAEVEAAMKTVRAELESESFRKAMAEASKIDAEQMRRHIAAAQAQLKNAQADVKQGLEQAKQGLEQARQQLQRVKAGIDELRKDGLLKPGTDQLKIEWDGDIMLLNGQRLSAAQSKKYQPFFEKESFTKKATSASF